MANSGRRPKGRRKPRNRVALVFGEDSTDTEAIKELIYAAVPNLDIPIKPQREPMILRDIPVEQIPSKAQTIVDTINAELVSNEVVSVFVHQDCDRIEPAHEELATRIEEGFRVAGRAVHAVVPAWELETWWFLWPDAPQNVVRHWNSLAKYKNRNLGLIENSKEELRAALRPKRKGGSPVRDYRTSDGAEIARAIRTRENNR